MSSNAIQGNTEEVFYGCGILFDIKQVHCDACWNWLMRAGFPLRGFLFHSLHRCRCQHNACFEVTPEGKSLKPSCVTHGRFKGDVGQNSTVQQFFFFFSKLWWKPHLTHPLHPISVNQPHLSTELINQAQLVWLAVPLWVLEMPVVSTGKKKHWILLNTHHFYQLTWSQHHHDDLARGA